jgi:hypothetical protein
MGHFTRFVCVFLSKISLRAHDLHKNIFAFANQRERRKERGREAVKGGGGREGVRGRG